MFLIYTKWGGGFQVLFVLLFTKFRPEKESQKGKMKNTKVQKSKRCENVKSKRCENVKKINAAFENPKN